MTADQTPTPTRLIRNCEEVGLFEDLQHVNPFEETFRRAVESKDGTQSGSNLDTSTLTGDETLHTPHVMPYFNLTNANRNINDMDDHTDATINNNRIDDNVKLNEKCDRIESDADMLMHLSKSNDNNNSTIDESLSANHESKIEYIDEYGASHSNTTPTEAPASIATTVTRASVIYVPQVASVVQPVSGVIYEIAPKKYKPILPMTSLEQQQQQNVPQIIMLNTNASTSIENRRQNDINGQRLPTIYPKSDRDIAPNNSRNLVKAKLKEAILKIKNSNAEANANRGKQSTNSQDQLYTSALAANKTVRTVDDKQKDERIFAAANHREKLKNQSVSKVTMTTTSVHRELTKSPDDTSKTHQLQTNRVYEKNRAAAAAKRYRLKFKNEHNNLKRKNSQLEADNERLMSELRAVKTILLAHQDCSVTRAMAMGK